MKKIENLTKRELKKELKRLYEKDDLTLKEIDRVEDIEQIIEFNEGR